MSRSLKETIVVVAGSRWTDTAGTDHRLASAIAELIPVLWVDPVTPALRRGVPGGAPPVVPGYEVDDVAPRVRRLRTLGPPGFTRPGVRRAADLLVDRALRGVLERDRLRAVATVLMSGRDPFPSRVGGQRVLHVTDDWPAGAALMGLGRRGVERTLRANIASADLVTAVSPGLAELLASLGAPAVHVVPNGCPQPGDFDGVVRRPVAGLLGQLNERLDVDLLEALGASVDLEVVGPVTARDPRVAGRLETFLHGERVTWLGPLDPESAAERMEDWGVGLTPYLDDAFNRSSFPLKTLEYLAAGLPVVSTDLPASRWLECEWVRVAETRTAFVELVARELAQTPRAEDVRARKRFATGHTWRARAVDLLELVAVAL